MKSIVVGLGNQGKKRIKNLHKREFIGSVDPFNKDADFRKINQIPIDKFDTVFICVPEKKKLKIINFCLKNKKNFLVEKPFPILKLDQFQNFKKRISQSKQICYVGYNHRFEPYIKKIKFFLEKKILGKIYSCKLLYGNGTSKLIKKSLWRDNGSGVVEDLFPHLLDLCDYFYDLKSNYSRNSLIEDNKLFKNSYFENKSPDNAILISKKKNILFNLEASYCMWKNTFYCEIIGENGSLHLNSLSKWAKVKLEYRKRVLPSGVPLTKTFIMKSQDNTWKEEHKYFRNLIINRKKNNFDKEMWINSNLLSLINLIK